MRRSVSLFRSLFIEHPASVDETYSQHFVSALGFGAKMVIAGVACMVHGLLPAAFESRGSDTVCALHERMVVKRRKNSPSAVRRESA
jgi:Family of unknown function (DUF6356)